MNSFRSFFSLLRFTLTTVPVVVWLFPMIFFPMALFRVTPGEGSGFTTSLGLGSPMPLVYSVIIGFMFFRGSFAVSSSTSYTMIPDGEFLITRPVSRPLAYLARITLYFTLMLALPVLNLGMAAWQPSLSFSLYQSKTQHTEAATKRSLYQAAFPDSSVIKTKSSHESLLIPHGNIFIAGWSLWLWVLAAMGLQALMIVIQAVTAKFQQRVMWGVAVLAALSSFVPLASLEYREQQLNWLESAFFGFSHHWGGVAVLTLLLAAAVQWFACQRIRNLEVV